jgi:hypothetical protein
LASITRSGWLRRGPRDIGLPMVLAADAVTRGCKPAGRFAVRAASLAWPHARLLAKLDARDRVQLVIIAYGAGLVAPAR